MMVIVLLFFKLVVASVLLGPKGGRSCRRWIGVCWRVR